MRQQLHSYSSCRGTKDGVDGLIIYFILVSAEHWRYREVDLTHSFHDPKLFHMVIKFRQSHRRLYPSCLNSVAAKCASPGPNLKAYRSLASEPNRVALVKGHHLRSSVHDT